MSKQVQIQYLLVAITTLVLILSFSNYQSFLDYENKPLADAYHYDQVYDNFLNPDDFQLVRSPFNTRILTPWIASLLPFDTNHNFFIVNSVFTFFSILFLFHAFRLLKFQTLTNWLIIIWFLLHFTGPIRHTAFNPLNVDIGLYFFEVLILLIIIKKRFEFLWLVTIPGIMQKEVILAYLILLFILALIDIYLFKWKYFNFKWIGVALIMGLSTLWAINMFFPSATPGRNPLIVMYFHLRETILHPVRFLRWLGALTAAYGILLMVPLLYKRSKHLKNDPLIVALLLFSLISLFFGLSAGDDHTRIILIALPFIIPLIHLSSKNINVPLFVNLVISIPIFKLWRSLGTTPDQWFELYSWQPDFQPWKITLLWIAYGMISVMLLLFVRWFFNHKASANSAMASDL